MFRLPRLPPRAAREARLRRGQRASSDLHLNQHFHTLLLDGVYASGSDVEVLPLLAPDLRRFAALHVQNAYPIPTPT